VKLIEDIQAYDKYLRYDYEKQRRETWPEAVARVIDFLKRQLDAQGRVLPEWEWHTLAEAILAKEIMPSMRILQMAGPALERCNVGAYNCAYMPIDSPRSLAELLYILMQGTGVGFSVEKRYVDQWVNPTEQTINPIIAHPIEDNTESWCDAFHVAINCALYGQRVEFDYSKIRPKGSRLKTKGGTASGHEPLKELLDKTQEIILSRAGKRLRAFDLHRLACLAASIVQVGGVRRAALISLSDLNDKLMRDCKRGEWWQQCPELAQANNSAVMSKFVPSAHFFDEWNALASSGSGERGIFVRDGEIPERRKRDEEFGTNPCGEILLRPREFCNLTQAIVRPDDDINSVARKVKLATMLGTIQSCLTKFNYITPRWKENCEEERLLGVDLCGVMDNPLFAGKCASQLDHLKRLAITANRSFSSQLGIPMSAAITCNKPGGNSSQFLSTASGLHPRYAKFYIRRMRLGANSPFSNYLRGLGVPVVPENGSSTLEEARVWVFELPVKAPEGSVTRDQLTALEQFEFWRQYKLYWTEHNPSCTIYVQPDEWRELGVVLYDSLADVGGLSFLPKDDHTYSLAPYEEIDEQEYERRLSALPSEWDFTQIKEEQDLTELMHEFACVGDKCLI